MQYLALLQIKMDTLYNPKPVNDSIKLMYKLRNVVFILKIQIRTRGLYLEIILCCLLSANNKATKMMYNILTYSTIIITLNEHYVN